MESFLLEAVAVRFLLAPPEPPPQLLDQLFEPPADINRVCHGIRVARRRGKWQVTGLSGGYRTAVASGKMWALWLGAREATDVLALDAPHRWPGWDQQTA